MHFDLPKHIQSYAALAEKALQLKHAGSTPASTDTRNFHLSRICGNMLSRCATARLYGHDYGSHANLWQVVDCAGQAVDEMLSSNLSKISTPARHVVAASVMNASAMLFSEKLIPQPAFTDLWWDANLALFHSDRENALNEQRYIDQTLIQAEERDALPPEQRRLMTGFLRGDFSRLNAITRAKLN